MKFAAIADVHGNRLALEAVLADIAAAGLTEVVNLGDHVSGPLEARRTADLLIERGFPSIRGDQDRRLAEFDIASTGAHRGDYLQLDRKHLNWPASLPPTMVYRDEVFLCHGTPRSDTACWLDLVTDGAIVQARPIEDVEAEASGIAASLILCGHTHIPRVVRLEMAGLLSTPGVLVALDTMATYRSFIRFKSRTPHACYAILERESLGWSITMRCVPYDHMSTAEMARRNGLSTWARAFATGWTT